MLGLIFMQSIMYHPKCHSFCNTVLMLFLGNGQEEVVQGIHQLCHHVIFCLVWNLTVREILDISWEKNWEAIATRAHLVVCTSFLCSSVFLDSVHLQQSRQMGSFGPKYWWYFFITGISKQGWGSMGSISTNSHSCLMEHCIKSSQSGFAMREIHECSRGATPLLQLHPNSAWAGTGQILREECHLLKHSFSLPSLAQHSAWQSHLLLHTAPDSNAQHGRWPFLLAINTVQGANL